MDWDKLRIFHAVADAGSLTHAGETLNLSQSAVSRQIRALEESLNTVLFHRHARGLILTEQGELLFDATSAMEKHLDAAGARIRDSRKEVFGELRVTTTTGFGLLWLAPRIGRFYDKYPDLKVDLMLEERVLDLPMREADVAIRMKEPSQADLIRKRLMSVRMKLYATQAYLNARGTPQNAEELSEHRLLCQRTDSAQIFAGANFVKHLLTYGISQTMTVNNYYGVLQGVSHDLGIGALPDYVTQNVEGLIEVLPGFQSNEVPVYLAYPSELRQSRRIAAFRDFVQDEIIRNRRARHESDKPHPRPNTVTYAKNA